MCQALQACHGMLILLNSSLKSFALCLSHIHATGQVGMTAFITDLIRMLANVGMGTVSKAACCILN